MDSLEEIRRYVKLVDETLIEMYKENQQLKDTIPKNNSEWLKWGKEKDKEIERLRGGLKLIVQSIAEHGKEVNLLYLKQKARQALRRNK